MRIFGRHSTAALAALMLVALAGAAIVVPSASGVHTDPSTACPNPPRVSDHCADVSVLITRSPAQTEYSLGQTVSVTVSATNDGPAPAPQTTVHVDLPDGLTLDDAEVGNEDDEFDSGVFSIDNIPGNGNNRTRTVTLSLTINSPGAHTITAELMGGNFEDFTPDNNEDAVTINVPEETTTSTTSTDTSTSTETSTSTATSTSTSTDTSTTTTTTPVTTSTTTSTTTTPVTTSTTTSTTTTTTPVTTSTTTTTTTTVPVTSTPDNTTTGSTTTPTTTGTTPDSEPPTTTVSEPVEGKEINAEETTGDVLVKIPGQRPRPINPDGELLPPGTKIDASDGTVVITSEYNGTFEQMTFWDGAFILNQKASKAPVTAVKLISGFSGLAAASVGKRDAQAAKKKGRKSARRLWGKGNKGHYQTRGRSGSATVRGTKWKTVDLGNGSTKFVLKRGRLAINDFAQRGKIDKILKGKGSYIAKPAKPRRR